MSDFAEFAQQNILLFIALFAIAGMLMGSEVLRWVRGIKTVNPAEALRLMNDQDARIVDIRDAGAYRVGHIPQALNIPQATLSERLDELGKVGDKPLIIYCQTGAAAQSVFAVLKKHNIGNVYSLNGGLSAWLDASLPVSRTKKA